MHQRVDCLSPIERLYALRSRCTHIEHRKCLDFRHQNCKHFNRKTLRVTAAADNGSVSQDHRQRSVQPFLDSIKWDDGGLVTVIAQDVDTGEVLMQAYSDRAGIQETLETRLATFYSRSRQQRWCKGETSGNYIHVKGLFLDCDRDSVVYLGEPDGPSCHTGAHTCWFSQAALQEGHLQQGEDQEGRRNSPMPTLLALEQIIRQRQLDTANNSGEKPSWTARLLQKPDLLCSKIREEASELCETLEKDEGKQRAASEMADLLYHSMVLLRAQDVSLKDVCKELRSRFGTTGIEEKAARPLKQPAAS